MSFIGGIRDTFLYPPAAALRPAAIRRRYLTKIVIPSILIVLNPVLQINDSIFGIWLPFWPGPKFYGLVYFKTFWDFLKRVLNLFLRKWAGI